MKAIEIKMIDLQPMTAREANDKGHRIGEHSFETEGYEVTYGDGYKSWCPKEVADAAYFRLSPENDGTKVLKEDVENFVTNVEVMTVGEKTTVVNAHTLTGFDMVRHSSCVDPKNLKNLQTVLPNLLSLFQRMKCLTNYLNMNRKI